AGQPLERTDLAVPGDVRMLREGPEGDRRHVDRPATAEYDACEVAALKVGALAHLDGSLAEVGVGRAVLDDHGDALHPLAIQVSLEARRAHQIPAVEGPDRCPRVIPLAQAGLQP